jgi:hypothetical protein
MSTVFSPTPASLGLGIPADTHTPRLRNRLDGARGLTTLLLAAGVAALVVLAEQLIGPWADGHLLLGWVALWVVVLAGSALLAGPARRLARAVLRSAHGWSLALGEARAEVRLWQAARADHRVIAELVQASQRELDDEPPAAWGRFPERLADGRGAASHLRHP